MKLEHHKMAPFGRKARCPIAGRESHFSLKRLRRDIKRKYVRELNQTNNAMFRAFEDAVHATDEKVRATKLAMATSYQNMAAKLSRQLKRYTGRGN